MNYILLILLGALIGAICTYFWARSYNVTLYSDLTWWRDHALKINAKTRRSAWEQEHK